MLRKRIAESLTARIFLITAGVLLAAGAITFSFIAWASPSTYTAVYLLWLSKFNYGRLIFYVIADKI